MPLPDSRTLLPIVVGANLRCEFSDRPMAESLRDRILAQTGIHPPIPVVCTDVWYLQDKTLHTRPTLVIGGPGVNALAAHLSSRLPTVLSLEDCYTIQMDLDLEDPRILIWGFDAQQTAAAVKTFENKYLNLFLESL